MNEQDPHSLPLQHGVACLVSYSAVTAPDHHQHQPRLLPVDSVDTSSGPNTETGDRMVTWNINIMLFIAITALVHVTIVMAREMQGPDVSIVRGCG